MPKLKFDHCVIHVSDWPRSTAFYRDVLGAQVLPRGRGGPIASAVCSSTVTPRPHPDAAGAPAGAAGQQRPVLRWSGPIDGAIAHLATQGVPSSSGRWSAGRGGTGVSLYFRDPDGSLMEFISYA